MAVQGNTAEATVSEVVTQDPKQVYTVNLSIMYLFLFDMSHKPDGAGCMHAGDIKVD